VLTGHSKFTKAAEKRARIMSSIGQVTRTQSVYVVDRAKQESVDGTALVERDELETFRNTDELRDVIRERLSTKKRPDPTDNTHDGRQFFEC